MLGYGERTFVFGNDRVYIQPCERWSNASAPSSNVRSHDSSPCSVAIDPMARPGVSDASPIEM